MGEVLIGHDVLRGDINRIPSICVLGGLRVLCTFLSCSYVWFYVYLHILFTWVYVPVRIPCIFSLFVCLRFCLFKQPMVVNEEAKKSFVLKLWYISHRKRKQIILIPIHAALGPNRLFLCFQERQA